MNEARVDAYVVAAEAVQLQAAKIKATSHAIGGVGGANLRRISYELEKLAERLRDEYRAMIP